MAKAARGGSGGGTRFKYQERDADSVKKRAEQDSGAFDSIFKSGIDTWRAKVGDNLIRFIPPTWEDPDHYGHDVWVHSYIGADSGSYLCPKKMLNKACPICQAQKEAADAGDTEEAKALKATKKVAAWIIDRDDDNPTPQVYLMSWTMDRDIAALCHNKRTGKVLMIDHPDNGYDVTIKRAGAGLKTRYFGMAIDRDPSPMMDTQKETNAIMEYVDENPIPSTLLYKSADYLQSVVDGTAAKKDPDADEEDRPSARRRKPAEDEAGEDDRPTTRRRAAAEDDEPAPRRRAAAEDDEPAPRRRAAAEDDDADTRSARRREEADPDDEPAPRRRAAAEDDEPAPRRRRAEAAEEDVEDRPSTRRRPAAGEEPAEEEERPARRRRAEEDEPAPRRRANAEDEEPAPRRRAAAEDDEPAPRRRRAEAEEDEPAPRRRRAAEEDEPAEEEERRPIKRTRV